MSRRLPPSKRLNFRSRFTKQCSTLVRLDKLCNRVGATVYLCRAIVNVLNAKVF